MYNYRQYLLILFFTLFAFSNIAYALDDTSNRILDLRKQIETLTKQAEQYKGNINKKQKEANSLKNQIDILNNQISKLTTQITITEKQIDTTKIEIDDTNSKIFTTTKDINEKQVVVVGLVQTIYQRDRQSLIATLIKNPSLSIFMNEVRYTENLNDKLVALLTDLKAEKQGLETDKQTLESKETELESLNKQRVGQKRSLDGTKSSKSDLLVTTKGQEQKYQELLSEVERKKEEFFSELKNLENQAVKNGAFIVHVTASHLPPKGGKFFSWPYTDDFRQTQGYGYTTYAKRGAYGGAPHNGIDIASGAGSSIHPIAPGSILASGFNSGWGNWVAVRHDGDVVSLYGHMSVPSGIANGTQVNPGDVIGYEGATGNVTGSHLHLSIYKDFFTYINPKNGQLYFNYFEGSLNPLDYL